MRRILTIQGMSCQHCVNRVKNTIEALPGVTGAEVTIGSAAVSYDPSLLSEDALKVAVQDAGYTVTALS